MDIIQLIWSFNIIYMKKFSDTIDISILEKAKILEILTKHIAKYTGSQANCYACNIIDNILVLGATNSASIGLLKNYQRDILKDINFEFSKMLKVKIVKIKFKIIRNPNI